MGPSDYDQDFGNLGLQRLWPIKQAKHRSRVVSKLEFDSSTYALIFSTGISIVALAISLYVYQAGTKEERYSELDALYLELLKLGIEHPKFTNPRYTRDYKNMFKDENERLAYECYAHIAWNICETIFDRKYSTLFETWKPLIMTQNKLHRSWFDNPENSYEFKERFRRYVAENVAKEDLDLPTPELVPLAAL